MTIESVTELGSGGALEVRRVVDHERQEPPRIRGDAPRRTGDGQSSESETPSTCSVQIISTSRTGGEPHSAWRDLLGPVALVEPR